MHTLTSNDVAAKQAAAHDQTISEPPRAKIVANFPPLEVVTKPNLTTAEAAYYLNRSQQTMRLWAKGNRPAPIAPVRINGQLAWATTKIKAIAGVEA